MPDPIPNPEPLSHEEDDEGTEYEDEDEEEEEDEEAFYDDDEDEDEEDDYVSEFEDEEIDFDDEEDEEDYDETEGVEPEQQNVQQPLVPQVSRSHSTVDLEASSSTPLVALEEEATNETGRQDREAPPSSDVSVESSEWNRSEMDGLICPICMEAWTNEGDHHICCLPCGHIYGMSCIKKWLELRKNSAKCPQCNQRCTLKGVRKLFASQLVTVDEELHKLIKARGMRWTVNGKERDLHLMRPTSSTQPPPQSFMDQITNQLVSLSTSQGQMIEQLDKMRLGLDQVLEQQNKMQLRQGQIVERLDKMEQKQASSIGMLHQLSWYVYWIYQNQGWNYPPPSDFPPPGFYPPPLPPDIPYTYPPLPPPPPSDA